MRFTLCMLFLLLLFAGCGGDTSPRETQAAADDTTMAADSGARRGLLAVTPSEPPCPVAGQLLSGNWLRARENDLMLAVIADSTTFSEDFGPGHRVLVLYDTRSCREVERHVLPVNVSPDYAYRVADINYNRDSRLVAVTGFNAIYVYDLAARRLLPKLEPGFPSRRYGVDAQSGMVQRLEVWEHYLVGYAQDYGAFAFDLADPARPRPVMPLAEYRTPEDDYQMLFLLASGDRHQALMPIYRRELDDFAVNPLFPEPVAITPARSAVSPDKRFVVLRRTDGPPLGIDLERREQSPLPPNLANAADQAVFDWLKKRES